MFRGHFTSAILDECFAAVARNRPDLDAHKLQRTRQAIESAFDDSMIEGYEHLIDGLALPDPDDRHVLAAAIQRGVPFIVTFNLKNFPNKYLACHGVTAGSPDAFVLACCAESRVAVVEVVTKQAAGLRNPPSTVGELLDRLAAQGLARAVEVMRRPVA